MKPHTINNTLIADENLKIYLRDIARYTPLSASEENELAVLIRKGDRDALKKMVQSNLRFVVSVARNYQNQGLPLVDLVNEGNLGLMRAAKRFDEKKNFKFISYAVWWIRQAILQSLADHSRILRVPVNRVATIHQVGIASARLEQKLNRLPNSKEIANELGIPEKHVTHSMKVGNRHTSLDAPLKTDGTVTFFDFLHDKKAEKPDEFALNKSQTNKIMDLLKVLPERQQLVMRLYFGIEEETDYTLDEIGGQLNLTRERIRQIKDAALSRLRRSVLQYQLSDYVE